MTWRAFVAVLAVAFAAAAPALASSLKGQPLIEGQAVVGSQLIAKADWWGPPTTTVKYRWELCPDRGSDDDDDDDDDDEGTDCYAIAGATSASYTPVAADAGHRIRVWVEVSEPAKRNDDPDADYSDQTPVVQPAPSPPPAAEPSPSASSSPQPSPSATTTPAVRQIVATTPPPVVAAAPTVRYLLPFPVVRIMGQLSDGGAVVTLLRVTAPRKSKVRVDCAGASCPVPRLGQGPGRVRAFERFLQAGTRIVIRVRRPEVVGKHVRITIRDGKRPARRDSCLLPGSARAAECPQP
jgi:hypothetical protein